MKVAEVKRIAKENGVAVSRKNKTEIVRAIQEAEGNFPCFKTAGDYCDRYDCRWRADCLK